MSREKLHATKFREKALLVLVKVAQQRERWPVEELAEEFRQLVLSTGITVEELVVINLKDIFPATYIGKGKVYELAEYVSAQDIDVVIFNNNLNYSQQRNLEDILNCKTIDRTQLILDIFAHHAHTVAGSLQVELAQLEYLLPRLKGKGLALSRLGGGIGTRGPGEKKLEVDRRRILDRITRIKGDLEQVRQHRQIQRKRREREKVNVCSLVGYTNAGKSTLLNTLTQSDQLTADSLFTTLDPKSRTLALSGHCKIVVTDTVGFIYNLPHGLIESFKATLEELRYADVLVHMVDISNKNFERLIAAVDDILKELEVHNKPVLLACNKIDMIDADRCEQIKCLYPDAVFISALHNINCDQLLLRLEQLLSFDVKQLVVRLPFSKMEVLDYLYTHAHVQKVEYKEDEVVVLVIIKEVHLVYLTRHDLSWKEVNGF